MKKLIALIFILSSLTAFGQQPQTGSPDPQALQGINSKWANGVGPGYWPYQKTGVCTGLNLCISSGTVPQCMGTSHVTYAGTSSFALTNNATNYVYLDLDNSCVPAVNTVGYSNRNIAIAKIVTSGGAITSLSDDRFWGSSQVVTGGVDAQTGTSYTLANTDRGKLVTLSNGSVIAVTLPTTLGATFRVSVQNIGAGTATLTPSSGTINGAGSVALTGGTGSTGQGAELFFDGTNWFGVMGGGSGGGGGGTVIRECIVTTGDPAAASPVLTNNNNSPAQCGNDFAVDVTIVAAACWANAGTPQVTPILTGGSGTSILTGPLTCGTATWAAGTVNGSPVIHSFSANGATCASTPCTLDSNISSAGAATRYIVMKYDVVGPNTGTTPVGIGTANNHEILYNNAGSVAGVTNGTAGQSLTSQGASSTPAYAGCHLSNGVVAKTGNYTLAAAEDGALVTFNGTTLTATLPNPPPNATWCASIININSGSNLTVSRNSLVINTGATNLTLLPYQSTTLWTDGSNYFATTPFSGVTTTTASQAPSLSNAHSLATILNCPDSSGSGTAQSCNTSPSFTPAGGTGGPNDCVWYTTTTTNSGVGLTININSLGAKSVSIPGASGWTTVLTASVIPANKPLLACYDGTNWDVMQTGTAASGGGGSVPAWVTNSPDTPPLSPNAMDDEFTAGSLDPKWTVLNPSSLSITRTFSNNWMSTAFGNIGAGADKIYGYTQPVPAGSWKVRAKLAFDGAAYNYFGIGLFIRRSSVTKDIWAGGIFHSSYGLISMIRMDYTEPATDNAETDLYNFESNVFYIELDFDGTSTYTWLFSTSGADGSFTRFWQETNAFLGANGDQVGFMTFPYGDGNVNFNLTFSIKWFRRVA